MLLCNYLYIFEKNKANESLSEVIFMTEKKASEREGV